MPSYIAARRSGAATAAAGNIKTIGSDISVYTSHNGGAPLLAAYMAGAELSTGGTAATCTADQELPTGNGSTSGAAAWDAIFTQSGYQFAFKAGGTPFNSPQCGSGGSSVQVSPNWDAVAYPTDPSQGSTAFCSDGSGEYQTPYVGTAFAATGKGCATDLGATEIPVQ